ncbi:hypothetical protein E4T52_16951 [Aureobasidium sp. EXF-3400]|nr:hypothetical protein E4T51_16205 [Aureobasidium sp. EXF-12344]KAI4767937.1 hypothetical protein E4T52_16951 [Aureobasidium sp. EXF-3400]
MDVAKFLDRPVRFNPRRPRAPLVLISSSLPPSASHESASPTSSLTSTSSFELDATLSSMDCFLPMQNPRNLVSSSRPERSNFRKTRKNLSETRSPVKDIPLRATKSHERQKASNKISLLGMSEAKCDGKRPACSTCILKERCCEYSARVGVTSQTANKERLRSYATILGLVRDADPEDCDRILQDLRAPQTLNEAIETVQKNWILESGN